jgi:molybdopterin-binding protein
MSDINTAEKSAVGGPILSAESLYFAYPEYFRGGNGDFSVSVDRIDVYSGERVALIGPNGAGKTTLLQLIALLEKPDKGVIRFNNTSIQTANERRQYYRSIAYVPQKPVLYDKSVKDNIVIGLKIRGAAQIEIEEKTARIAKALKISHLINRSALKISGGEARRVMLARALVLDPKILFLDEPFGDLDETVRKDLIGDLLPILSGSAKYPENLRDRSAIIFVSHNQDETYQLADRFIIMLKGRIVQDGNSQEVFSRPASQEVAEFIGLKNVLPGKVIGFENDIISVSLGQEKGGAGLKLFISGEKPTYLTGNIIVSIPPESIIIATEKPQAIHPSSRNMLSGKIERIIPSRYFSLVEVNCAPYPENLRDRSGVVLTATLTKESIKELALAPGKTVVLLIKSTAIRIQEA